MCLWLHELSSRVRAADNTTASGTCQRCHARPGRRRQRRRATAT